MYAYVCKHFLLQGADVNYWDSAFGNTVLRYANSRSLFTQVRPL